MVTFTKRETERFKTIKTNLKVLEERTKQLRQSIKGKKKDNLNLTEQKRLLNKIKSAKRNIADAGFI